MTDRLLRESNILKEIELCCKEHGSGTFIFLKDIGDMILSKVPAAEDRPLDYCPHCGTRLKGEKI